MNPLEWFGRQALFAFDPETAHGFRSLRSNPACRFVADAPSSERLKTRLCGLEFPNPLGMAAGYDKNGEVPDALLGLGFGFAEVGTVTPLLTTRQSEAAHLPADRRRSGDQPARLQQ